VAVPLAEPNASRQRPKKSTAVACQVPRKLIFVVATAANRNRARAGVSGVHSQPRARSPKARRPSRAETDAEAIASCARNCTGARAATGGARPCGCRSPTLARPCARPSPARARAFARRAAAATRRCAGTARSGRTAFRFGASAATGPGLFDLFRFAVGARTTEQHRSPKRRKQTQTHHRCFSNHHLVSLPLVFRKH